MRTDTCARMLGTSRTWREPYSHRNGSQIGRRGSQDRPVKWGACRTGERSRHPASPSPPHSVWRVLLDQLGRVLQGGGPGARKGRVSACQEPRDGVEGVACVMSSGGGDVVPARQAQQADRGVAS